MHNWNWNIGSKQDLNLNLHTVKWKWKKVQFWYEKKRKTKKNKKNIHILIIRIAAMCTYPVQPVCTSLSSLLLILLFIKSHILFLHILLVFAHLTCLAHLVLHFSLFYYTFYSLFLFFTSIYALVWCYFYIICILCTVHWADLIWSTFHFWLYPV